MYNWGCVITYEFFASRLPLYGKNSLNELQSVLLHKQDVNSSWRDCPTYSPTKVFYCNELFFWHEALFSYMGVYRVQCTGHTHTASIHRCWLIDNSVHCCSHAPANRPALTAVWIRSWHSAPRLDDETVESCHTMLVSHTLNVAGRYRTGMTYIVCMTESRQPFTWFARYWWCNTHTYFTWLWAVMVDSISERNIIVIIHFECTIVDVICTGLSCSTNCNSVESLECAYCTYVRNTH